MVGSAYWLTCLLRPEYFILNAGLIFKKIHNIEQSLKDEESRALEEFWGGQSSKKGTESSSYTALSNRKTHAFDDSLRRLSVLELWLQSTEDFSTEGWFSTSQSSVVPVLCFLMNFTYNVLDSHYIQKDLNTASKQRGRLPACGRKAKVTNCVISYLWLSPWFIYQCFTIYEAKQKSLKVSSYPYCAEPVTAHDSLPISSLTSQESPIQRSPHTVKPTAGYNGKIFKMRNKDNHGLCRPLK